MFKSADKWLPGYLRSVTRRPRRGGGARHLIFCVADHYEPLELLERPGDAARGGYLPSRAERLQIVRNWAAGYPEAVARFRDSDGVPPRHTFFCAPNDYAPDWMEMLAGLCRRGCGEVELHLHHRDDTPDGLAQKLTTFRDLLRREHGLLGEWKMALGVRSPEPGTRSPQSYGPIVPWSASPSLAFAFIHGNWALCNSSPDGDWCGVNEELSILSRAGCYADLTFPSAPSPTQPRMVNEIYRATDRRDGRGPDRGVRCEVKGGEAGVAQGSAVGGQGGVLKAGIAAANLAQDRQLCPLMLIQGPLALDWSRRKWGVLPRLDNGGVTHHNPPMPDRIDLWARQGIHVRGRPEWIFVKVYTHGCVPSSSRVFLGDAMRAAHQHLQSRYNDGANWRLHYVTAREMYNIIRAAEDGQQGEPGEFRDYEVSPPPGTKG